MSVNDEIIKILESRRGDFFSGQELAQNLGVSRQSIWKGIKALQNDGHKIIAKTNVGYSLEFGSDVVTSSGILSQLNDKNIEIYVMNTCDSTILVAKRLLQVNPQRNFLVISDEQTGGLGRFGKNFFSPKHSIYMSVVLSLLPQAKTLASCNDNQQYATESESPKMKNNLNKTTCPPVNPLQITCATAVAVVEAIKKMTNTETKIKWVNDILLNGKKICGILTEGTLDFETGQFKNVIIGIGINCNQALADFPKELQHIVSSLSFSFPRNNLIAEIVNNVTANIFDQNTNVMDRYRENSMIIGKTISYQSNGETIRATVENIDSEGHLLVINADGTHHTISSGSVNIDGLYEQN